MTPGQLASPAPLVPPVPLVKGDFSGGRGRRESPRTLWALARKGTWVHRGPVAPQETWDGLAETALLGSPDPLDPLEMLVMAWLEKGDTRGFLVLKGRLAVLGSLG